MLMRLTLLSALVTAGLAMTTAVLVWDSRDHPNPPNLHTTEAFAQSRMIVGMPLVQYQYLPIGAGGPIYGYQDAETGCIYIGTGDAIRPLQGEGNRPTCANPSLLWNDSADWSLNPGATRARLRDRSHGSVQPRPNRSVVVPDRSSGQAAVYEPVPSFSSNAADDAAGGDRVSGEGERGADVPDAGPSDGVPVLQAGSGSPVPPNP